MRSTFTTAALAALVSFATLSTASSARAEEEFDVAPGAGSVKVTTKGAWHINKEYPWKLTVGGVSVDKAKFTLSETSATLAGVPKGKATLKGAVCSGPSCKPFTKEITID